MLGRGEVVLAHADVDAQLCEEDVADPDHYHYGEDEMRPVAMCLFRGDVAPGKPVEAAGDFGVGAVAVEGVCFGGAAAADVVEWEEDGEEEARERDEDDELCLEVAEEKVGVQAALIDDLLVFVFENRHQPSERTSWRWCGSLSFGDEVCFRLASQHVSFVFPDRLQLQNKKRTHYILTSLFFIIVNIKICTADAAIPVPIAVNSAMMLILLLACAAPCVESDMAIYSLIARQ